MAASRIARSVFVIQVVSDGPANLFIAGVRAQLEQAVMEPFAKGVKNFDESFDCAEIVIARIEEVIQVRMRMNRMGHSPLLAHLPESVLLARSLAGRSLSGAICRGGPPLVLQFVDTFDVDHCFSLSSAIESVSAE